MNMSSSTTKAYSESMAKGDRISPCPTTSGRNSYGDTQKKELDLKTESKYESGDRDSHKSGDGDKKMYVALPDFKDAFCDDFQVSSIGNDFLWWNNENQDTDNELITSFLTPYDSQITLKNRDSTNLSNICGLNLHDDLPGTPSGMATVPRVKRCCLTVKSNDIQGFFNLLADEHIQNFLHADSCRQIADKYLLAMVFAYFKKADFTLEEYTSTNFFLALYIAHDIEEDDEELKDGIFPWAIGKDWRKSYPDFLRERDKLFKRMNYSAIVSRRCCEEIMAETPDCVIWKRTRPTHHSGAIRPYNRTPRGPRFQRDAHRVRHPCPECDVGNHRSSVPRGLMQLVS
ncbi:speedy protein 1-B-like [Gigantopelta aegis]|uniref:speedy protein 1-B-like n=1 Tax=Gigantopelta aegis TaxID=1735272 RepID=UPI001B88D060|nr:speedy protein 1-B-like [Gigantopelta aegis]